MNHTDRIRIIPDDSSLLSSHPLRTRLMGMKTLDGETIIPITTNELQKLKNMLATIDDVLGDGVIFG